MSAHLREAWGVLVRDAADIATWDGPMSVGEALQHHAGGGWILKDGSMVMMNAEHDEYGEGTYVNVRENGLVRVVLGYDSIALEYNGRPGGAQVAAVMKLWDGYKPDTVFVDYAPMQGTLVTTRAQLRDLLMYGKTRAASLIAEAMPSWRAQGTDYWNDFDCVISTDANGRGRNFEVYTHGKQWATRHSIADAKASVEEVYGPLTWSRIQLPIMSYDHPYFGEIGEEMTDPHSILVADLPKLGKLASAFSPSVVAAWEATRPWSAARADLEAQNIPGVVVGHARGTEDASFEGGRIVVKEPWFRRPPEVRKAILYHEAGHALEGSFTLFDFQRLGIDSPLDLIDWPGAQSLGGSYTEVLAEAYSALWCDPGWFGRMKASRLRDLVSTMAHERGFPLP